MAGENADESEIANGLTIFRRETTNELMAEAWSTNMMDGPTDGVTAKMISMK